VRSTRIAACANGRPRRSVAHHQVRVGEDLLARRVPVDGATARVGDQDAVAHLRDDLGPRERRLGGRPREVEDDAAEEEPAERERVLARGARLDVGATSGRITAPD
jgi:hypothetical protein